MQKVLKVITSNGSKDLKYSAEGTRFWKSQEAELSSIALMLLLSYAHLQGIFEGGIGVQDTHTISDLVFSKMVTLKRGSSFRREDIRLFSGLNRPIKLNWESLIDNSRAGRRKCRYQLLQEDSNISRRLTLLMSFIFTKTWKPELELKPSCFSCEPFTECSANSQSITLSLREHMVRFLKEPKDHGVFSHLEEEPCTQKDISAFSL